MELIDLDLNDDNIFDNDCSDLTHTVIQLYSYTVTSPLTLLIRMIDDSDLWHAGELRLCHPDQALPPHVGRGGWIGPREEAGCF